MSGSWFASIRDPGCSSGTLALESSSSRPGSELASDSSLRGASLVSSRASAPVSRRVPTSLVRGQSPYPRVLYRHLLQNIVHHARHDALGPSSRCPPISCPTADSSQYQLPCLSELHHPCRGLRPHKPSHSGRRTRFSRVQHEQPRCRPRSCSSRARSSFGTPSAPEECCPDGPRLVGVQRGRPGEHPCSLLTSP